MTMAARHHIAGAALLLSILVSTLARAGQPTFAEVAGWSADGQRYVVHEWTELRSDQPVPRLRPQRLDLLAPTRDGRGRLLFYAYCREEDDGTSTARLQLWKRQEKRQEKKVPGRCLWSELQRHTPWPRLEISRGGTELTHDVEILPHPAHDRVVQIFLKGAVRPLGRAQRWGTGPTLVHRRLVKDAIIVVTRQDLASMWQGGFKAQIELFHSVLLDDRDRTPAAFRTAANHR